MLDRDSQRASMDATLSSEAARHRSRPRSRDFDGPKYRSRHQDMRLRAGLHGRHVFVTIFDSNRNAQKVHIIDFGTAIVAIRQIFDNRMQWPTPIIICALWVVARAARVSGFRGTKADRNYRV